MSEPVATYAFLPWLRRGVGAEITRADGAAGSEARPTLPIALRFNADEARTGHVSLQLFGPGEVRGFDVRAVTRTWPRSNVMDAEPNYFPLVDFDQADLPWRYTPARATGADRLTPWLALIVIADDEMDGLTPPQGAHLGLVNLKDAAVLPVHSQLWAWAHVQVIGETAVDEARAAQLLATEPQRVSSRLLCPRRLKPRTSYTGLLVPAFQRGVLAGMGQDPADSVDGLAPAWADGAAGPLTLPVYFHWRFGTGQAGDFESLARLIKKFATPPTVGVRDMDVSAPSPLAPPAHDAPIGMRGMLMGLTTPESNWAGATRATWITWLKQLLNLPVDRVAAAGRPRTVTPPLYGQWHAAADRCAADDPAARPTWFQKLSVDPRLRVAAALGTQVVQRNQEALMASAWEQVERIRQLNEELRQAQVAREAAARIMIRHVMVPDAETVLTLTAPLFARVRASPRTIRALLAESPVPRGLFEGAFRRIARPLGPMVRRQGRPAGVATPGLIDRLNRGDLSAAPVPPTSSDLATPTHTGAGLAPGVTAGDVAAGRRRNWWLRLLAIILALLGLLLLLLGLPVAAAVLVGLGAFGFVASGSAANDDLARRVALREGTLTGDAVRATTPASGFVPAEVPLTGAPSSVTPAASAAPAGLATAFRESLGRVFDRIAPPAEPAPLLHPVNIAALRTTLEARLDPRRTIAVAYQGRFTLTGVSWQPEDPLEPILAAPEFPQPLYAELKKISVEWLLPGFSGIPINSATLLRTNPVMEEAFMVGANHEIARELLWREYPTDQRGTCFRQFWDVAGAVPEPGQVLDPEQLKDITLIHSWGKSTELGTHAPAPPPPDGYLVLLVRGDLLRRYPNTLVYAARALWTTAGLREIQDPAPGATDAEIAQIQEWPLFSGLLEPDGTFFGFRLTASQVKGSNDPSGDPGWYFVLQEHSSEPRFGLDVADTTQLGVPVAGEWNNLSWGSLVADAASLDALAVVDLDADLPDTTPITDPVTRRWHATSGSGETGSRSSDLAYITFQRPMRVGIHGADMIP